MASESSPTLAPTTVILDKPVRLAILQRVCKTYRLELFRSLSAVHGLEVRLFLGEDVPNSKTRSASDLSGIDNVKLPTRLFRLGSRVMPWHKGLQKSLREFEPDVILCEGESNFLGYLQALWFRKKNPQVGLIHWGGGGLPGQPLRPGSIRTRFIHFMQRRFDALLTYSSFCRNWLIETGHAPEKISIATNVGNTSEHLELAANLQESKLQALAMLGIPDRFTVLYIGTMEPNKRPDVMIELARITDPTLFNYVLIGTGPMVEPLRARAAAEGLTNVHVQGHASDDLPLYFRASDVVLIPGRGGIVISEAMAWGVPVIVHEADGTEHDLIHDGKSGVLLHDGSIESFRKAIESMCAAPEDANRFGEFGRNLLMTQFGIEHMVESIVDTVTAVARKSKRQSA